VIRRTLCLAVCALAVAASPAAAQLPAGGFASPDVEFVKNVSTGPSSGGKRVGGFFYLTTGRELHIFDIEDPEDPVEVGTLTLASPGAGDQRAPEEDPDTNGKLLFTTNGGNFQVYDVSDPTSPKLASELEGLDQHTVSCVLDCTWVYGSEGAIVDVRDPAKPKLAEENWLEQVETGSPHDVTEISPGLVMTATAPIMLLDLRADPLHPKVLRSAEPPGFTHQVLWPHEGTDAMFLSAGEALGPACEDSAEATFITWSASDFRILGQWAMSAGTFADGAAPSTTFCTHWFTEQPAFRSGGMVAMGWYEHGTRFLKVGLDGKIEEIGFFLPSGSRSSAAYWITDRVLYIADYYRGLDVVKWTGEIPPSAPAPPAGSAPAPIPGPSGGATRSTTFDDLVKLPPARKCLRRVRIRVRKHAGDPVTALSVRAGKGKALKVRGKKLRKPIAVRLRAKRVTLQVRVRTRSGFETAGGRTYRRCR
jgi:hypothetical protein